MVERLAVVVTARWWTLAGWLVAGAVGCAAPVAAQQTSGEETTQRRLEEQEKEIRALREEVRALRDDLGGGHGSASGRTLADDVERFGRDLAARRSFDLEHGIGQQAGEAEEPLSGEARDRYERLGAKGGIFAKPFLVRAARNTYLGGYMDLEYRDPEDGNRSFSQHRFVPFIFSEFAENLRFAAEIEFEFGGSESPGGGGETKVEFAFVDWTFSEELGFRAGAILVPLGKFNLIHDSPVNDLTDRPLVDRFVIPTTLTEAGLGFFGSTYAFEEEWKIDYEAYLVNGFRGLVADSTRPTGFRSLFNTTSGVRGGRPSLRQDNNDSVAGVGRLAVSPFLGAEFGASAHAGKYDDRADNWLVIWALDAIVQPQRFLPALAGLEILGEFARAEISRNTLARASGVPDDLWGIYGQVNYHFMFDVLTEVLPAVFREESTFTAVCRLDHVELGSVRSERITFGINFRPIEDTVFKFDYQLNFEDWDRDEVANDAFLFSVATYF
jgi:hypothetical protein